MKWTPDPWRSCDSQAWHPHFGVGCLGQDNYKESAHLLVKLKCIWGHGWPGPTDIANLHKVVTNPLGKTLYPTLPPEAKLLAQQGLRFTEILWNAWARFTFDSAKLKTDVADSAPDSLTSASAMVVAEVRAVLKALVIWAKGQVVRRGNPPEALNVPVHSCWVGQECNAQTARCSGHFSGLCLQQTTLRNEVTLPNPKSSPFSRKAVDSPSPMFLKGATNPLKTQHQFKPIFVPSVGLEEHGELTPASCLHCLLCYE